MLSQMLSPVLSMEKESARESGILIFEQAMAYTMNYANKDSLRVITGVLLVGHVELYL